MDTIVFSALFGAIALVVGGLARIGDRRILLAGVILFAAYLALDDFVTGLPHLVPALDVIPGHWNWTGKLLSLALSVGVIIALRLSPATVGFRMPTHPRIAWIALALFVVWGACLGLLFKPGAPDADTLAFQATMPGLAEEIAYRGIAPALLLGLLHRKPPVDGVPWAVIGATSLLFGLWHALGVADGRIGFDALSGLFPFLGSLPGGWLRFKTNSLLVPVAGHALANVAFHVAGAFAG